MQWLLRYNWNCSNNTLLTLETLNNNSQKRNQIISLQYILITHLLQLSHYNSTTNISLDDEIYHKFAVHSLFVQHLSSLPVLSRAAVFRSALSIFGLEAILTNPFQIRDEIDSASDDNCDLLTEKNLMHIYNKCELNNTSTTISIDSNISHSIYKNGIYFTTIIDIILHLCQHNIPLLRLYSLQTLETWLSRVESDIYNPVELHKIVLLMDTTVTNVSLVLLEKCQEMSLMLCSAWSHPSKMVRY